MASKVFIVTGASKGIGAAITQYLLKQSHKVVATARSEGPLKELKKSHPDQVEYVAGDMVHRAARNRSYSRCPGLLTDTLVDIDQVDRLGYQVLWED